MTAASSGIPSSIAGHHRFACGTAGGGPRGHGKTEHRGGQPHRCSWSLDEAPVQSRGIRGGDGSGTGTRASGADADCHIRCGERRCIRRSRHSLLRREDCGDRQYEGEQHEHRSDYRHREDGPGAPLTPLRVAHHRSPAPVERTARRTHREPTDQPDDRRTVSGCRNADQVAAMCYPKARPCHHCGCRPRRLPPSNTPCGRRRDLLQPNLLDGELHPRKAGREHQQHGGDDGGEFSRHAAALPGSPMGSAVSPRR